MTRDELETLVAGMSEPDRRDLLSLLRQEYRQNLHPLEHRWNTTAEAILEAIDESSDLTQRGIRGVLAEATFRTTVLPIRLAEWTPEPVEGDKAYDFLLRDSEGPVRVQVKMQRRERGAPMVYRRNADHYIVETQRTRSGKRPDEEQSRPYP